MPDDDFTLFSDDFRKIAQRASWRYAIGVPSYANMIVKNVMARDPHEVMEELRREDPDAHANLSEHIVLPPRTRRDKPSA